ncbi:hypothetical protein [Arthrobacter flavus]|uniref:Uncharacterized protein n=1 Tax=Arthrobacter flavus TaxID=95172 RepID=A0ABW4QBL4_9MICC
MGGLTLVDPTHPDDRDRRTMRVAYGVVSGLNAGVTIGGKQLPLRVLAGLASGVAALRFAAASESIDLRLERKLCQFGVQHPRRWMAVGTAVFIFAGYLADRAAAKQERRLEEHAELVSDVVVDHSDGTTTLI